MKKQPCIICGEKKHTRLYKFPHGTLNICCGRDCRDKLLLKTDGAVPIVWVGKDDFTDYELLTEEEIEACPEGVIDAARTAADRLWDGRSFGDTFHEIVAESVSAFEQTKIEKTPLKELPLLLGSIKDDENKRYLEKRLKGG